MVNFLHLHSQIKRLFRQKDCYMVTKRLFSRQQCVCKKSVENWIGVGDATPLTWDIFGLIGKSTSDKFTSVHFNECVHFRTDLFDSKSQSDLLTLIAAKFDE